MIKRRKSLLYKGFRRFEYYVALYWIQRPTLSIRLCFAIDAAIDIMLAVGELENMVYLLLTGGDAAGVFALDDIDEVFGHFDIALLDEDAVLDYVDCGVGIDEADDVKVYGNIGVDFDDILLAYFAAGGVLYNGDGAFKLAQPQKLIQLHAVACGDVVYNDAVGD